MRLRQSSASWTPSFARVPASGRRTSSSGALRVLAERDQLVLIPLAGCALLFGALVATSPKVAFVLIAAAVVLALSLRAPLTVLVALLALTAIVPYELEHRFAIGANGGSPGLLFSDALLLAGLFRAALVLPQMRLERRRTFAACAMACFVVVVIGQTARGLMLGANRSVTGAELRCLLGFGALLIAMPILEDPRMRRRLLAWMLALGLTLGLLGIAQWTLHISFGETGDFGVRQGVSLTNSGVGQLQGGLYVYPVAVLLSLAALVSGQIRSRTLRALTAAVLVLNSADLLLTYERTMWIATVLGAILVFARASAYARRRALRWLPVAAVILLVAIVLSPSTFTTAEERFASVGEYKSDNSVRYRVIESEHVLARIREHPLTGSALGATIHWGRPYEGVPAKDYSYSHDGYLWLSWKLGVPAAALLILLMVLGVLWRGPPDAEPTFVAVRHGSQAALAALLVISATFPIFNSLPITAVVGLLLAIAAMPQLARPEPARPPA
jgi:hypothetical protein